MLIESQNYKFHVQECICKYVVENNAKLSSSVSKNSFEVVSDQYCTLRMIMTSLILITFDISQHLPTKKTPKTVRNPLCIYASVIYVC